MKWTIERLEKECRKVLKSRTSLKLTKLPDSTSAQVQWSTSGGKAAVIVDGHKVALLNGVLHEILHVVLDQNLTAFDEQLLEGIIETFEDLLAEYVKRSRSRSSWWRDKIVEKAR